MKGIVAGIWNWWKSLTVGHRVILIFLVALVVVFGVYLDEGPKPWEDGVEPRKEAGKRVRIDNYAVDGIYRGVIVSLVLAVLLVPFARLFGRPFSAKFKPEERRKPGKVEALLLLFVVLGSAVMTCSYALPRFKHSMWFDEDLSMRRCIVHDHLRVGEDGLADRFGEVAVRPVRWEETLWFYESPNNHMFFSLCARLIHTVWPAGGDPMEPYFNAKAIRLAALIPALLTLGVAAVLLSVVGFRIAAFAFPLLFSMHPWFVRFASEGRGYAMAMLFVSLCLLFFWRAAATGRWRWFAAYGLVQFLVLFTNPASLWFLVVLNGAGFFALLLTGDRAPEDRRVIVGRFIFANAIAAMVTFIMMMPLQLQVRFGHGEIGYGVELFKDMGASFLAGMRWATWSGELGYLVSVQGLMESHSRIVVTLLVVTVVLAVLGLVALALKGGRHAFLIPVILIPVPLFLAFTYWKRVMLYHWYTVNMLPLFWIAVAIGIGLLAGMFGGRGGRREAVTGAVLILAFGVGFWWLGEPQRRMLIEVPIERPLEAVRATREVLDPFDPRHKEVITIGFHKYPRAYDPGHYRVKTADEMRMMMEKADAEGKPLFVHLAIPDFARAHKSEIMVLLDDQELFEEFIVLYGVEETATRWVMRYKPGSLKAKSSS